MTEDEESDSSGSSAHLPTRSGGRDMNHLFGLIKNFSPVARLL